MATGLIGISVVVTLRNPPNTVVHGLVAAVNPQTSTLTLQNVYFPATGHRLDGYNVEGHAIADIKVDSPAPPAPAPLPQQLQHHSHVPPPSHTSYSNYYHSQPPRPPPAAADPKPAPPAFVDPAILSVGRRAPPAPLARQTILSAPQEAPASPIKPVISSAPLTAIPSPSIGVSKDRNIRKPSAATLEKPFSSLDIEDAVEPDSDDDKLEEFTAVRRVSITKTRTGRPMEELQIGVKPDDSFKRTRRGGKARKKEVAAHEKRIAADPNHRSQEVTRRGKDTGWRQTPLLQDPHQEQSRTPGVIAGQVGLEAATASSRKNRKQRALEAKNGWATEDATDIQDMPEFDFAENLSKFDKRRVFEAIKNEDTTADEDRLVSFNRLPRPGTHGGKNLHPTENVLDGRRFKSTSDTSSDDELSELDSGHTSRRAMSRTSAKRVPARQTSGLHIELETHNHPSAPASLVSRATRSLRHPYATSTNATGSPKPTRTATPPDSPMLESAPRSCFRLVSNNRKCHTITPGGMAAVEESAEIDFGLTEDMIAENAGRGIAEIVLSALNPGGRRLARDNHNARPVIVVLAGNHRGGARAVAAARQLQTKGPKVLVALLGFERNADWDRDVRRQVDLFKKFGGSVRAWPDLEDALKRLQAPPELIIDALLGRNKEFDALGEQDRRTVLSIVGWANKSHASVLAVEMPSGVGGSTGDVAILEGEPLEVRPKHIVCLGAPRSGLLKAFQKGSADSAWAIWIVDIGVNLPWKNAGIGGGKGIKFGDNFTVQAEFDDGLGSALRV